MVVVSDFVVGFRKVSTALSKRRRAVIVCLLCVSQWVYVLVVSKYVGNNFAFMHDMFVKSVHYPRSTAYEGVGLVLRVFANSVTCKATHVVFVDEVGGFHGIDVFVGVERGQKGLSHLPNRKGDETEPHICEIPKRILLVSLGRDTSRPALGDVGSWGRDGRGLALN